MGDVFLYAFHIIMMSLGVEEEDPVFHLTIAERFYSHFDQLLRMKFGGTFSLLQAKKKKIVLNRP